MAFLHGMPTYFTLFCKAAAMGLYKLYKIDHAATMLYRYIHAITEICHNGTHAEGAQIRIV